MATGSAGFKRDNCAGVTVQRRHGVTVRVLVAAECEARLCGGLETCQSGRMGLPAKELPSLRRAAGSNPVVSATRP